MINGFFTF